MESSQEVFDGATPDQFQQTRLSLLINKITEIKLFDLRKRAQEVAHYKEQSNENRTSATKWQWNLFYSKVIAKSLNTFIPLGDETINSSLVERGSSLMDPKPHPLLHFLVGMKPTSNKSFFMSQKMWKSQWEKSGLYGGCWGVSQPNLWSLSVTILAVCGRALSCKKDYSVRQHSRAFWLYGSSQHPQPPRNEPYISVLCLHAFPMLNEHTLHYAHLQSNNETTVWICAFSLCSLIRNNSVASFCEECVLWRVFYFHLTAPYKAYLINVKILLM